MLWPPTCVAAQKMDLRQSWAARLEQGESIDVRGDGKAGGGLVLVMQSFGAALARSNYDVQDWPLFSSARKGANVRAYLRFSQRSIETSCQVTSPDIAILMNEAAAKEIDFAEGTEGALYIVNSECHPDEIADRYRLAGVIATVPGDQLALRHLGRPLGNIAVLAALSYCSRLVDRTLTREVVAQLLEKRRVPERIVAQNLALFDEAIGTIRIVERPVSQATTHKQIAFSGYGRLPVGAQSALRTSTRNRTAGYGRPGVKIEFADPSEKCNGCSLCVAQCPEGIINFHPDLTRGTIVYGAKFDDYCKVCRECVAACPLDLFSEVSIVARPEGAMKEGG